MERRRYERAGPDGLDEELEVWLATSTDGRGRVRAELVDLSVSGAQLRLVNEVGVPTHVGGAIGAWFVHRPTRFQVTIRGLVRHRREELGQRVLGVEFDDRGAAQRLITSPLARHLNRRAAFRAEPAEPIPCTVIAPRETRLPIEAGRIVDVSTGGLALDVSTRFEAGMAGHERVDCVFRLPGAPSSIALTGQVRHRTLQPDGRVRYGVQFHEPDPATRDALEAVRAFVEQRQRELTEAWLREHATE